MKPLKCLLATELMPNSSLIWVAVANRDTNNNKDRGSNISSNRKRTRRLPILRTIITTCSKSRRLQLTLRLRNRSKSWLFSIILIKIQMTLMQPKKSSKKLLMLTKFCKTLRREKFMIWVVKKLYKRMLRDKDNRIWTLMIFSLTSSVVVVMDSTNNKESRFLSYLRTLMSRCLISLVSVVSIAEMKFSSSISSIQKWRNAKTSKMSTSLWPINFMASLELVLLTA